MGMDPVGLMYILEAGKQQRKSEISREQTDVNP